MFRCKKNSADAHNEINGCYYEKHSVGEPSKLCVGSGLAMV
jgi:hypothetical protein